MKGFDTMWLCSSFVYFMIFSCLGWIYETIACTIYFGYWDNRGFLYGPVCPIYGVGAMIAWIIHDGIIGYTGFPLRWWHMFLISVIGSAILELFVSWILERFFHAIWWDYSRVPLNFQGRICLPASLGFGVGGLIIVYILVPFLTNHLTWISPIGMEWISMVLLTILSADLTLTISSLSQFEQMVYNTEERINARMSSMVDSVKEKGQSVGDRLNEEWESLSKENLEQLWSNTAISIRLALRRIRRFRYNRLDKKHLETLSEKIRSRISQWDKTKEPEPKIENLIPDVKPPEAISNQAKTMMEQQEPITNH